MATLTWRSFRLPTRPHRKPSLDPLFRHVLRLSFFDAIPADEYQPMLPGLFNRTVGQITSMNSLTEVHAAPFRNDRHGAL
jgi:hypothetical protein